MLTAFTTLRLGIKMIGLTAIAAILLTANVSMAIQTSYAQFGVQQEQESQETGEQQVESDGGLTATLNGETFGRGDTIIISGTVAEREGGSTVYATILDPDSIEIDFEGIRVNTDGTFRHGFIAGEDSVDDGTSDPMTKSGTYTIALEYSPPGLTNTESTELTFEYDAEAPPTVGGQDDSATITAEGPTTTFQNLTEGFRIGVPTGWVEDDGDIPDSARQQFVQTNGFEFLGAICPQEQALPKIGGLFDCVGAATEGVEIIGYPDLSTRPEFAQVINQNQNITLNDLIAFDMERERNNLPNPEVASRMSIEDQTETMVNVVDPNTNQTVQTLPAIEVAYGLPAAFGDEINVRYVLLTLADNGNTGYRVAGILQEPIQLDDGMPPVVRQAFDSFELLPPSSRPNVTSSLSSQEQSQQQLVQSAGGLTARLNANNFTTGDTTVNGTVAERGGYSYVTLMLIDPRGEYVLFEQPRVTADNTFTFSSVAGEPDELLPEYQMVVSGNYLMQVQHGTDIVEFTFAYEATGNTTGETQTAASPAQEEQPQQLASTSSSPFSQQLQSQQQEGGQSQPQQQQQQQQQSPPQNAGDSVSMGPGSSTKTTDAFSPNPIQVSVGSTVTWTNDDSVIHTVNSGTSPTQSGLFDSPIMNPEDTFEHTFTEAGDYPYFCLLHPNMVGTVSVS